MRGPTQRSASTSVLWRGYGHFKKEQRARREPNISVRLAGLGKAPIRMEVASVGCGRSKRDSVCLRAHISAEYAVQLTWCCASSTHAMVCMSRLGEDLRPAARSETCKSETPGITVDCKSGISRPSRMTRSRKGMANRKRRRMPPRKMRLPWLPDSPGVCCAQTLKQHITRSVWAQFYTSQRLCRNEGTLSTAAARRSSVVRL